MTDSLDEDLNNQVDWEDLKSPSQIDKDFQKLWMSRLNVLIKKTGKRPAEFSGMLKSKDKDLIGELLRGDKQPTRQSIHWLSQGLAASQELRHAEPELNTTDLIEIDLSLHAGFLPKHILELDDHHGSSSFLPAIRNIINAVDLIYQDTEKDLENTKYWLDRFNAQTRAWSALIHFTQKWRYAQEWYEIEQLWNEIQQYWSLMVPEQKGWAAILRAQTLKLRGLTYDALTFLEFAQEQFPTGLGELDKSPTRLIRYNLYLTWGDAYREIGRREDAMIAYDQALKYANGPIERFRLKRKRLDTWTRVSQEAPVELRTQLEDAVRDGYFVDDGKKCELDGSEFARCCFALAWFWKDKGMETLGKAKEYQKKGVRFLEQPSLDQHQQTDRLIKIGYQYYADTLLRNGEFERAIHDAKKGEFGTIHYARRAYSKFIYGRAQSYLAFSRGSIDLLDEAIQNIEMSSELYSLMGTSQRRAHVLIELAKFCAIRQILKRDYQPEKNDFTKAKFQLDLAETLLKALGTFKIHSEPAVVVNRAIVHFLEWIADPKQKSDRKQISDTRKKIDELQKNFRRNSLVGHQARAFALSAAFRMASAGIEQRNQEWKRTTLNDVMTSANLANSRDYLTLYDCRWLISLGAEESKLKEYLPIHLVLENFDEYSNDRLKAAPTGIWTNSARK